MEHNHTEEITTENEKKTLSVIILTLITKNTLINYLKNIMKIKPLCPS